MKHIDLFAGVGGFSLASHSYGFTTTRWADVNPFSQRVMSARFPDAIAHDDITTMQFQYGEADLITGGFPCQELSRTRQGRENIQNKTRLWKQLFRAIYTVQPYFAIGENVHGLLGDVNADVWEEIQQDIVQLDNYEYFPVVLSAKAFGGPHFRPRLFLVLRRRDAPTSANRYCVNEWDYQHVPSIVGDNSYMNKRKLTAYGNAVTVPVAQHVIGCLLDTSRPLAESLIDVPAPHTYRTFKDTIPFVVTKRGRYNKPTPTASDYKGASQQGRRRGTLCEEAVKEANPPEGLTVYPNAAFSEWMMGFPPYWCDI